MTVIARTVILAFLFVPALPVVSQGLLTRIIDTGAGHASVTEIVGSQNSKYYMVYDTGNKKNKTLVLNRVLSLIPKGEEIDLLVLSHSHEDHIAATKEILECRSVHTILRTGCSGGTIWSKLDSTITNLGKNSKTRDVNLSEREHDLKTGDAFNLGKATVTFLAGGGCGSDLNTSSIVIRLEYAGKSILFTGDAVGRDEDQLRNPGPIETEAELLSRHSQPGLSLNSDVIIAPHHGSDYASSTDFIKAVSPEWVIFPAGSRYDHPRQGTAQRYLSQNVPIQNMLRTDLGDNEGGEEWDYGATNTPHYSDPPGDDDIEIIIQADSTLTVRYR